MKKAYITYELQTKYGLAITPEKSLYISDGDLPSDRYLSKKERDEAITKAGLKPIDNSKAFVDQIETADNMKELIRDEGLDKDIDMRLGVDKLKDEYKKAKALKEAIIAPDKGDIDEKIL